MPLVVSFYCIFSLLKISPDSTFHGDHFSPIFGTNNVCVSIVTSLYTTNNKDEKSLKKRDTVDWEEVQVKHSFSIKHMRFQRTVVSVLKIDDSYWINFLGSLLEWRNSHKENYAKQCNAGTRQKKKKRNKIKMKSHYCFHSLFLLICEHLLTCFSCFLPLICEHLLTCFSCFLPLICEHLLTCYSCFLPLICEHLLTCYSCFLPLIREHLLRSFLQFFLNLSRKKKNEEIR